VASRCPSRTRHVASARPIKPSGAKHWKRGVIVRYSSIGNARQHPAIARVRERRIIAALKQMAERATVASQARSPASRPRAPRQIPSGPSSCPSNACASPAARSVHWRRLVHALLDGSLADDLSLKKSLPSACNIDERAVDHLGSLTKRFNADALVVAMHTGEILGINSVRIDPVYGDASRSPSAGIGSGLE